MKKIQKKARQENKNIKEDECSDDKGQKTKVKEEEQSPPGTASFLNDSCSDTEPGSLHAGPGGDGYHPHTHPQPPAPGDQNCDDHHHHHHFLPIKEELLENEDTAFYSNKSAEVNDNQHPVHTHQQDFNSGGSQHDGSKMDNGFIGYPYNGGENASLESNNHHHPHHHHHHHHHHNHIFLHQQAPSLQGLNPIDRLYSMQTSYFCGEESSLADQ
ncbi:hypothetical protein L798_03004 [Zootermopsis nevadensis]|uniref:Uncharacterized protein n=2 Tax=Zootermopsis nevadensis TaxID=136037 RepID=A0A067RGC9_ZOONE|nr:hypothetical protein L798_03004 [Zootermopsis nevadensis]